MRPSPSRLPLLLAALATASSADLPAQDSVVAPFPSGSADPLIPVSAGAPDDSVRADLAVDSSSAASRKVVVKGRRAPLRETRVRMEAVRDVPSLAGEPDVARALLQLPSVAGSSDWSNKLYVRGSSADQNLVLFDDAVVWSPSHFGGMMSTFVVDGLSDLRFHPGGFEARQGNRLASVLEVRTKGPSEIRDTAGVDGIFRWSNFAFSLEMEKRTGPWWVVGAGRYTYFDRMFAALRELGWSDLQLDYRFHDVQAGAGWSDGSDTVRASVYSGHDDLDMSPVRIEWSNHAVPVQWSFAVSDDFRQRGSLSWSWFDQTWGLSELKSKGNAAGAARVRQEVVWTGARDHVATAGYEGMFLSSRLTSHDLLFDRVRSARMEAWIHEGYLQDQWSMAPGWGLAVGTRFGGAMELDGPQVDPRATLSWAPDPAWRFEAHGGRYTQYLASLRFDEAEQPNEFWIPLLPPARPSRQILWALSAERSRLPAGLRLRGDLYAKDLRDVPYHFPNRSSREDSLRGGDWFSRKFEMLHGWAAGAEGTLARDRGVVEGSLSYAWGMSVLHQDDFETRGRIWSFPPRWAPWDQRHRVKFQGGVRWLGRDDAVWRTTRSWRLRSTANVSWSTGMARTRAQGWVPASAPGQDGTGAGAWDESQAWIVRGGVMQAHAPDYFRLDLTPLDFRTRNERWYWSMLNVTGHSNPILETWDASAAPPQREIVEGYPFFPVMFAYEREF